MQRRGTHDKTLVISHLLDQFGKQMQHVVAIISLVTHVWSDILTER